MIKTIQLKNAQGHKSSFLKLSPGVNVIKGPSHSGKTTIIRGLKWAILNKPRGDALRSHFAEDKDNTKVAIDFGGPFVIREKGLKTNQYKIPIDITKTEVLEAMRTEVPQEVSDVTRMDEINIQTQHDPYFLIQDSPGKVGKALNRVVGLNIIDKTLDKANSLINRMSNTMGLKENEIEEIEDELKKYEDLDEIEQLITTVDGLNRRHIFLSKRKNRIESLRAEIEAYTEDIVNLDAWLEIEEGYQELVKMAEKLSKLKSRRTVLSRLQNSIKQAQESIAVANTALYRAQKTYAEALERIGICPLCGQKIRTGGQTIEGK